MATVMTITSNYAGKVAGEIIGAAFKETDTLRLGLVSVADNVNHTFNLRRIRYSDGTVDYSCGHVPAGAVVLDEKIITTKKVKNDLEICKEDFRQTWSEDSMGASASNPNAPADIMEAITVEVLSSQAVKLNGNIWTGAAGTAGEIGGFVPQFDLDADVVKANNGITPIGAAITEANVESELKKVLSAIPIALKRATLTVLLSPDVFQAYAFYLISKGISNDGTADEKQMKFGKYTLTECNELADNTIIVYEKANLWFVNGLQGDHNDLSLTDEDSIGLLTGLVRGKIVYNGGTGYYNGEDIVHYVSTVV